MALTRENYRMMREGFSKWYTQKQMKVERFCFLALHYAQIGWRSLLMTAGEVIATNRHFNARSGISRNATHESG